MRNSNDELLKKYPLYRTIPKDYFGNMRWRLHISKKCANDQSMRREIMAACKTDPLLWIGSFVWTFDPLRHADNAVQPFVPYPFQETAFDMLFGAIGKEDVWCKKSRDMGATWMMLLVFMHRWLFHDNQSFLLGSAKEEMVDKRGNKKSLFWKLDFILKHLPHWMRPELVRNHLVLDNKVNGSSITGEAMHPNFGTSDRTTAMLLDEFAKVPCGSDVLASTQSVTACRFINSTPFGINNAHYDYGQQDGINRLLLGWWEHPEKSKGLYTHKGGVLEKLDKDYEYPENFQFIKDDRPLRSPWYDREQRRMPYARLFAQEVDMDERGAGGMFFNPEAIQKAIIRNAQPPFSVGNLLFDRDTCRPGIFRIDEDHGNLKLWTELNDGEPPYDDYVIGADISQGTGASNTTAAVWHVRSQTKVAEYCNPHIRPEAFTRFFVSLATWFNDAKVIWEDRGPGKTVSKAIQEIGYSNYYYRPMNHDSDSYRDSDKPGWAPDTDNRMAALEMYRAMIENDETSAELEKFNIVNTSKAAMQECLNFVFDSEGKVKHVKSDNKEDPSGAKSNHGDLVVADMLACLLLKEQYAERTEVRSDIPDNCLYNRRKEREDKLELEAVIWEE